MLYIKRQNFTKLLRGLFAAGVADWAVSDLFIIAECNDEVPENIHIFKTGSECRGDRIKARIHDGEAIKVIKGNDIFSNEGDE